MRRDLLSKETPVVRFLYYKRTPPVSDHYIFPFWAFAYGRFDLIKSLKKKEKKKIQIFLWIEFKELVIIRISYKLMRNTPVLTG